jgi:preprotein translocase SecE subunit
MQKITSYLTETKAELKNVVWPKWPLTFTHTAIVIVVAVIVGYLSGVFDSIFKLGLASILGI